MNDMEKNEEEIFPRYAEDFIVISKNFRVKNQLLNVFVENNLRKSLERLGKKINARDIVIILEAFIQLRQTKTITKFDNDIVALVDQLVDYH